MDEEEWVLFVLSTLGYIPVLAIIGWTAQSVYRELRPAGQGDALLALSFVVATAVGIAMGVDALQGAVYSGRDARLLASLPVPARGVVGAKLAAAVVHQWLVLLLFSPPLLIYGLNEYGLNEPAGWLFAFKALLAYLLLPLPGLAVAAVLAWVLIRVLGPGSRREVPVAIAGMAATAVLVAGMKAALGDPAPRLPGTMTPVALAAVSLAEWVTEYVPPLAWVTRALLPGAPADGAWELARFAVAALAGWILAVELAGRLYREGLTAARGGVRDLRALRSRRTRDRTLLPARSPFRALAWREAALLCRTPAFFLRGLTLAIVVPVPLLGPGRSISVFELYREPVAPAFFSRDLGWSVLLAITLCVLATHGFTGPGTIGREGRAFWLSRSIPASPRQQVLAKLAVQAGAALVVGVPVGVLAGHQAGWNAAAWAAWLLGTGLAVTAAGATGLVLELENPRLDWTNPHEAYGSGARLLLALLASLGGLGGMWLVAWLAGEFGPAALVGGALAYLLLSAGLGVTAVGALAEAGYARITPPATR
ncbi:hypothetical protein [Hydrogenibacillus sp. N12]|uniref:putative ABC transporter permease subunit n=1 Tax=Hydrogenibacillus sp. N12 TaxID=2866627 RepID=UPI001C7D654B|nr:hypothetical protein [Hydrogenibacillus sp. N12]QZA32167.1 hypothetical protein K2M58_07415 [Hydrogenibacillus sp. N12]